MLGWKYPAQQIYWLLDRSVKFIDTSDQAGKYGSARQQDFYRLFPLFINNLLIFMADT